MSTRYKTEGEQAGVKRRMADYRARLRESGQKPRELWATDPEAERLRAILAAWRDEKNALNDTQESAAMLLKPV